MQTQTNFEPDRRTFEDFDLRKVMMISAFIVFEKIYEVNFKKFILKRLYLVPTKNKLLILEKQCCRSVSI